MQHKHLGSSLALIVALALGTGLGTTPATAHQLPTAVSIPMATVKLAKVTTQNLNLRASTTAKSKWLVTIPKNTPLTVTRTSGVWSYTTYKGKSGWVSGNYLKNAPVKAKPTAKPTYRYATSTTTLRATASDKGRSLGTVPHRAKVAKLGTSGAFTKVKYGSKTGYLKTSGLSTKLPAVPKTTYVYANATATLRASASDKARSLGTVLRRAKVAKLGTSGPFTKVKSGSATGYVRSTGLAKTLPAKTYRWATADTTARSSAKASATKRYVIKKGAQVEWLQTAGSWQLITTAQGSAWAPGSTLATKKPAAPKPPVAAKPTHRWTTANVNLRPTSSTKGDSLGLVPRGEKVTVVKSTDGWSNAKTSQGTGWMSSGYLATTAVPAKETYRWTTNDVNLRSDGSTDKPSLGVVPEGEKVTYLRSEGGWAQVKSSEGTGWISEGYLSKTVHTPTPETPPPASDAKFRWVTANLNLRDSGSTSGKALGVLPIGEKVTFIKSVNGWANVKTSKGTGWVSEAFLAKTVYTAPAGLKPNAVKVKNLIAQLYPYEVYSIGGVRQGSVGHSAGVALDLMIRDYKSASGIKAGDAIAAYLLENRVALGIDYLIWRDRIWLQGRGGWVPYSKGGYGGHLGAWNDTTLHHDHIHVETLGR